MNTTSPCITTPATGQAQVTGGHHTPGKLFIWKIIKANSINKQRFRRDDDGDTFKPSPKIETEPKSNEDLKNV